MKSSRALLAFASFVSGFYLGGKSLVGLVNKYKDDSMRNRTNMEILGKWLEAVYEGGSVGNYFKTHNYKNILIYGNGLTGQILYRALKNSDIKVVAIMDRQVSVNSEGILTSADSDIPDADCIVITPIYYYNQIYSSVRVRTKIPMVSVEEIFDK